MTHQKDKSRGASSITAFDSWFDIDLLIYNWQNASISLENQQLIKIILAETVELNHRTMVRLGLYAAQHNVGMHNLVTTPATLGLH